MIANLNNGEKKTICRFMPRQYKKYHPDFIIVSVDSNTVCTKIDTEYGIVNDYVSLAGADLEPIENIVLRLRRDRNLKTLGI